MARPRQMTGAKPKRAADQAGQGARNRKMSPDPILRAIGPATAVLLGLAKLLLIPSSYDAVSVTPSLADVAVGTQLAKGDFLGTRAFAANERGLSPLQNAVATAPAPEQTGAEPVIAARDVRFQPPTVQPPT